jgi:hypothetical protein
MANEKEMKQINEVNSAVREVIKRAVVDPDFRQLAVRDGRAALAKVSSTKLPGDVEIQFVDNYNKPIKTIPLPDPVASADELTEEELEGVAGGWCVFTICWHTEESK